MKAHAVGRLRVTDGYVPGKRNLPIHTDILYVCMYVLLLCLAGPFVFREKDVKIV